MGAEDAGISPALAWQGAPGRASITVGPIELLTERERASSRRNSTSAACSSIELVEGEQHKQPPHEQPQPEEERVPTLGLSVELSLDSLRLYLRAIGKVPLLTAEQEVVLAKRVERGD